jgi:hypothetical protein
MYTLTKLAGLRYGLYLSRILLFFALVSGGSAIAQPTFVEGTWVDGGPFDNDIGILLDRGSNRFFRGISNVTNTNSTVLFNNPTDNYNPKWVADGAGIYPSNQLHTNGARYYTVGGTDLNFSTTSGNYYTLIIGENSGTNNNFSVLETSYNPKDITAVDAPPSEGVYLSQNVVVTATLSAPLSVGETCILRWSTDAFATNNNFINMSLVSGSTYTGTIPFQSAGTTVTYYVFTSVTSTTGAGANQLNGSTADYLSLNAFNQSGQNVSGSNWSYTVQNAIASAGTGPWGTGATWLGGTAPGPTNNVVIRSGHNVTLGVAATCATLNILSGGTFSNSSNTLTIRRVIGVDDACPGGAITLTNNGTFSGGTGTILFDNSGAFSPVHIVSGTVPFNNVTIINTNPPEATGVNFGTGSTVNGTLTIRQGGYVCTNAPTYAANSTLNYDQSTGTGGTYIAGTEWTPNATSGQGVPANVSITRSGGSGTWTLSFGTSNQFRQCNNGLNIATNAAFTLSTNIGGDVRIGGNFTITGTFTHNNRALFCVGPLLQTINRGSSGVLDLAYLIINKSGKKVIVGNNISQLNVGMSGASGTANCFELQGATSYIDIGLNNRRFDCGRNVSIGAGSGILAGSSAIPSGDFRPQNGTTTAAAASGDWGTLRFRSDSLRLNTLLVNVTGGTDPGVTLGSDAYAATTNLNGGTLKIGNFSYGLNNNSVGQGISGSGNLSIGATGTLNVTSNGMTGTMTMATGSTVRHTGNGSDAVRGGQSYYNLIFSGAGGTKTLSTGTTSVAAALTIPTGVTFDIQNGRTLNVTGTGTQVSGSGTLRVGTTGGPSTVSVTGNWNGPAIDCPSNAANTSTVTILGDLLANAAITANGGTCFNTLVIEGQWSSTGTITSNFRTVYYRGNSPQTIKAASYFRLRLKGADKTLAVNSITTVGSTSSDSLNLMLGVNLVFPSNIVGQITQLNLNNSTSVGTGKITPDPTGRLIVSGTGTVIASLPNHTNAPVLGFNPGTLGWLDVTRNTATCVLVITTDITVGRYNFPSANGFIRLTNGSDFTIVGTTNTAFNTINANPSGATYINGKATFDSQRYIQLDEGSRIIFNPIQDVVIGAQMIFPVGMSTKASPAFTLPNGPGYFTVPASGTTITGSGSPSTEFTNNLNIGDLFVTSTGVVLGVITNIGGATSVTLAARLDAGAPAYSGTTNFYRVTRTAKPVILSPQTTDLLAGSQTITVGLQSHSNPAGPTNGTSINASASTRRSNWLAYANSTSATQEFSLRMEGNISNDFNQSMVSASVALFRTTGSATWEKYRVDGGFGTTGTGTIVSNTYFNRNNIGTLASDNLFAMGQTGGDLPDDPTFTWVGTTSSWTTTSNWNISGSSDPYPNSTAHFVNISSGGTASPTLPVATTNVATITQNAKTLTVPGGATLNVGGQYALNFPVGLLVGGTGTITTSGVTATGTGSSFDTQLIPGSYIYRASDNLFMGIVLSVGGPTTFTFMNMGHLVTSLENFTVPTAFNFINPAPTAIIGTLTVASGDRALTISGGTFTPSMRGRAVVVQGSGALIGVISEVTDAANAVLAAVAPAAFTSVNANILDGIPTSGSGSLVCDDNSTVIYGSNISQMFAPASYYNVSFADGRSLALPAAHIYRVSFATAQTITIRGRFTGRYWAMHTPITGLIYQFLNGSSLDFTVPNYNGGLGVTAGQLWRAYNAFNPSGNVSFGSVSSDRINVKFTYNRNADLTFQGPEFSVFSNGRCGDFEYIRNSNNSFIINGGNTFTVNGNTIFTNNGTGGDIMRFGSAIYTPGNQCNISFHGSFTFNGTNTGQPVFVQFAGSLHNWTFTGSGAITFPTNNGNIFIGNAAGPLTGSGTTPGFLNLTYNKPGVTLTLPAVATKHLVCLGTLSVSAGSIVAPGSPNNGNISGNAVVVNGTGNITSNGSNFVGAGAGGFSVSGNGSVTVIGDGNFGTVAAPGDVTISDNAVINLSAGTNTVGHGTSQDWIQTGGTVTMPTSASSPFQVARNLNISGGTITKAAGNVVISPSSPSPFPGGNLNYDGGTLDFSGATLAFNGTTNNQSYGSTTNKTLTVNNLTVNKAAGNVVIASGKIRILSQMTIGTSTTVTANTGNVTFVSGPSTTASLAAVPAGASLSGTNWTMERYFPGPGSRWSFLGTPITGASVSQLGDDFPVTALPSVTEANIVNTDPMRSTIFTSEENLGGVYVDSVQKRTWRALATNSITVGKGYRTFLRDSWLNANRVWDMTGGMTVGPQTINLSKTSYTCTEAPVRCNTADQGWNLIANPLPSAVDWNLITAPDRVNINNAFYRWETNAYRAYINGSETLTTGLPVTTATPSSNWPSSQGAFVYVLGTAPQVGSVTFRETHKVATSGTFFRTNVIKTNQLGIGIFGQGLDDQAGIWFKPEATGGFDVDMEAHKLMNPALSLFTSTTDGIAMAYNSLPMFTESTVVPLGIKAHVAGSFTLTFGDVNTFDAGTELYLKDNYLGEITPISEGMQYPFTIDGNSGSQEERFEIVFAPSSVTATKKDLNAFSASVVPNPSNGENLSIFVKNAHSAVTKVLVTDILGKIVLDDEFQTLGGQIKLNAPLANGVYQVTILNGNEKAFQKIVVNK